VRWDFFKGSLLNFVILIEVLLMLILKPFLMKVLIIA